MAVGPLRALLASHFQTSLARSTKEMGKEGAWATILLAVVLGLFIAVPILGLMFMAGLGLGPRLGSSEFAVPAVAGLFTLAVFVGGFMGGLMGGSRQLAWEQYRVFPVSRLRLFGAEVVASFGDVMVLVLAGALLALALGLGISRPALLPMLPLVLAEQLLLLVLLQFLVGSLAQRLAKRLRLAVFLLLAGVWLSSMWLGTHAPSKGQPSDPEMAAMVKAALLRAVEVMRLLPTGSSAQGLADSAGGHWGLALLRQLYPLGLTALLGAAVLRLLDREQETLAPVAEKGQEKLWSFRDPVHGLAWLQVKTLLGSHHGKFGFLMPVMTVVLIRGPLSQLSGRGGWAIPGAFAYLALFGNQFQFNQFGLDGHGVKGLFLLPLGGRDLLRGKTLGFALYQGLQALLLVALLVPFVGGSPAELLAGLLVGAGFFFIQSAVGGYTSAWKPRRIDRHTLKNNQMPLVLVLVGLGVSLASSLLLVGGFMALRAWAPGFLLPGLGILAGLTWLGHRLAAPGSAAYLEARREAIVEAMG